MSQRKVHSVNKALTEEERVRHRVIREQVEQEKAALIARGRRAKARHTMLREAVAALKTTREALGLSLADIKPPQGSKRTICLDWRIRPHDPDDYSSQTPSQRPSFFPPLVRVSIRLRRMFIG
jgi:hypothetical protein